MNRFVVVSLVLVSPASAWADAWAIVAHVKTPNCAEWDGTCQTNVEIAPDPTAKNLEQRMETRADCLVALEKLKVISEENGLIVDGYCEKR